MTPRPGFESLSAFAGDWTLEGASPTMEFRETYSGMPEGRCHLICRTRFTSDRGPRARMTIYSYRAADSTYLVYALMRTGEAFSYAGRPNGNRWMFDFLPHAHDLRASPTHRIRVVITIQPDTIRFVEEWSENGSPSRVTEDYRHIRIDSMTRRQ